jgi:hypothetical protein
MRAEASLSGYREGNVVFDPHSLLLEGLYKDEISAYRARRVWQDALEECFLLDNNRDFHLRIESQPENSRFFLRCAFRSACARYAFWRLINNQAPEAQYLIESGHIPKSETNSQESACAPDLEQLEVPRPSVTGNCESQETHIGKTVYTWISRLLK